VTLLLSPWERYAAAMAISETASPSLQSSPPLAGERVAFTGTLGSMTHAQAAALVGEQGGDASEHVSRQTTMLVVGEEGWPLEEDGQPSVKLRQVTEWNEQGAGIRIVNEADFLHLIGLSERRDEIRRLYTPAMLSRLLDVPVPVIRGWERAGLIPRIAAAVGWRRATARATRTARGGETHCRT
jgi:hypothetical protein